MKSKIVSPKGLLLGVAAWAVGGLAYENSSGHPQHSAAYPYVVTPTRQSAAGGGRVEEDVRACFGSSDNNTCRNVAGVDDGGMVPRVDRDYPPVWTHYFQVVGLLFACAYYYLVCKERVNDIEEVEMKSRQPARDDASAFPASSSKCTVRERARRDGLVLYDGKWYSVKKFVQHHPGGSEVLEQYLGSDISFVFRVMHRDPERIMKRRKPVRAASEQELRALHTRREDICNDMLEDHRMNCPSRAQPKTLKSNQFNLEEFEKDVLALYQEFLDHGYFRPTTFWLAHKTALVLLFLSLSVLSMRLLSTETATDSAFTTSLSYILPGMFLGLFWHQSGFLVSRVRIAISHVINASSHYFL